MVNIKPMKEWSRTAVANGGGPAREGDRPVYINLNEGGGMQHGPLADVIYLTPGTLESGAKYRVTIEKVG